MANRPCVLVAEGTSKWLAERVMVESKEWTSLSFVRSTLEAKVGFLETFVSVIVLCEKIGDEVASSLRSFAARGGRVAFVTPDSRQLGPTLRRVFDVTWQWAGTYDVEWRRRPTDAWENVSIPAKYGARAHAWRDVPAEERCYAASSGAAAPGGGKEDDEEDETPRRLLEDDDDDVVSGVVAKRVGAGRLVVFGDVDAEVTTVKLALTFCRRLGLDDDEAAAAERRKREGNELFNAGDYRGARDAYVEAIATYKGRPGVTTQRTTKATIFANQAECELRLTNDADAAEAAAASLELDDSNTKARLRRAKALLRLTRDLDVAQADLKRLREEEGGGNKIPRDELRKLAAALKEAKARRAERRAQVYGKALNGKALMTKTTTTTTTTLPRDKKKAADETPGGWSVGLEPGFAREWLVDCYRLRLVDDMYYGGCFLHGLYAGAGTDAILRDFLHFCALAVAVRAVPSDGTPWWNWPAFLDDAARLLLRRFEKPDAIDKYGKENAFSASFGGRSLRYVAQLVYKSTITAQGEHPDAAALRRTIDHHTGGKDKPFRTDGGPAAASGGGAAFDFADVGGPDVWQHFADRMRVDTKQQQAA